MSAPKKLNKFQIVAIWKLRQISMRDEVVFVHAAIVAAEYFKVHRATVYRVLRDLPKAEAVQFWDNPRYHKSIRKIFRKLARFYVRQKAALNINRRTHRLDRIIEAFPLGMWAAMAEMEIDLLAAVHIEKKVARSLGLWELDFVAAFHRFIEHYDWEACDRKEINTWKIKLLKNAGAWLHAEILESQQQGSSTHNGKVSLNDLFDPKTHTGGPGVVVNLACATKPAPAYLSLTLRHDDDRCLRRRPFDTLFDDVVREMRDKPKDTPCLP